jgi:hypothetical protein
MVSLYISRLGKVIETSTSATDTHDILRSAGYLSYYAIWKRKSVIALIKQTTDEFERNRDSPFRRGARRVRLVARSHGGCPREVPAPSGPTVSSDGAWPRPRVPSLPGSKRFKIVLGS